MRRGIIPLLPVAVMFPLLILIFGIMIFGPIILITFSSELKLLFQIAAAIMIFNWVRNTVGPGIISYAMAGTLIYIFVFLLPQFTLGLYALYVIFGFSIFSTVFWGIAIFRKHA